MHTTHTTQTSTPAFQFNNTQIVVGAVLLCAGGLIGMTGLIIGGGALVSATRHWLDELEESPSEVVRHKWHQTKAATNAGAEAWHAHNGLHAHSAHS
jgi:hypothetical protein